MNKEKKIEQNNWYNIYDSMGRPTDIYLIASNIKEAYEKNGSNKKDVMLESEAVL